MRARLLSFIVVAAAGCNDPVYIQQHRPLETRADPMNGGFAADVDLFVLPVRTPTNAEQRALDQEQMRLGLMQPVPWAGARDFDIQLQWAIKNLDAQPVDALFIVNGGNEFGDYDPAAFIDPNVPEDEQPPPPNLYGGAPMHLAGNEVRTGVLREDDLHENAIDLEAITRYPDPAGVAATPFEVIEHNSQLSKVGMDAVPLNDVIPAMVRYAITLSATGHVVLDYSVRVRDHSGKIAAADAQNLYVPTDAQLAPPAGPAF
jgi:hypothetical protein